MAQKKPRGALRAAAHADVVHHAAALADVCSWFCGFADGWCSRRGGRAKGGLGWVRMFSVFFGGCLCGFVSSVRKCADLGCGTSRFACV